MQSISTWISLKILSNTLNKSSSEGNIYFDRFRDITVRKWVGIMSRTEGNREQREK